MSDCKWPGCHAQTEGRTDYCGSHNRQLRKMAKENEEQPYQAPKIPRESKKRAKENKQYLSDIDAFLQGKLCAVFPDEPATEVHHMRGRIGKLLNDKRWWLAVSERGHKWIEANPAEAKLRGFSLERLKKYEEDQNPEEGSTD